MKKLLIFIIPLMASSMVFGASMFGSDKSSSSSSSSSKQDQGRSSQMDSRSIPSSSKEMKQDSSRDSWFDSDHKDRDFKDRDYKDRDFKDRDYKDRDYKDRDFKEDHSRKWRDKFKYDDVNVRIKGGLHEGYRDGIVLKFREDLRNDSAFYKYADTVDVIACGDQLILFGVVDDDQARSDIELRIKNLGGGASIQNRIIVK